MNAINEYDQIRNMLGKIRLIKEDVQPNNPAQIDMTKSIDTETETDSKEGEKITFDGINTVGFMVGQEKITDDVKTSVTTAVGEFLKATGLILDTITITVDDGQVILNSETIKNPGIDSVRSITFDTDSENAKIEVVSGQIQLTDDIMNLLQAVNKTFGDNQIGRNKLISSTQGGGEGMEQPQV
jgi:hypothetical protein